MSWLFSQALVAEYSAGTCLAGELSAPSNGSPTQQTPPMRLNPEWVEWLMGWPLGWTDLKPLATDRFREWQQQHSPFFAS